VFAAERITNVTAYPPSARQYRADIVFKCQIGYPIAEGQRAIQTRTHRRIKLCQWISPAARSWAWRRTVNCVRRRIDAAKFARTTSARNLRISWFSTSRE